MDVLEFAESTMDLEPDITLAEFLERVEATLSELHESGTPLWGIASLTGLTVSTVAKRLSQLSVA